MESDGQGQARQRPADDRSVTRFLKKLRDGGAGAEEELLQFVYARLRRMAGERLRHERPGHTLQATALANEVWLKLRTSIHNVEWRDTTHFYAACSRIMRHILVDYARRREPGRQDIEIFPGVAITRQKSVEILGLYDSLDRLAKFDPRGAKAVELRFFLGLSQREIASTLGISVRTVKRDLSTCVCWLREDLGADPFGSGTDGRDPDCSDTDAAAPL